MRPNLRWDRGVPWAGAAILLGLGIAIFAGAFQLSAAWFLLAAGLAIPFLAPRKIPDRRDKELVSAARLADQEHLQIQLVEERRSVDALADGLDIAIFICDERAHIQYANLRACEMFSFQNPIGRTIMAVAISHELEQVVIQAAQTKEPQNAELTFSGENERTGIAKAWPHADDPTKVFLSLYEVTDLRRLERIRQDFVANVSHELRTPMTLIRAMAETLLDEEGLSELSLRYLGRMVDEVDRLSNLTKDLLTLSAAESNPVAKQPCDLAEIVQEVVSRLCERAEEKGLSFGYEGPRRLVVPANAAQMTQVSINLIENAINYTTRGSVHVSLQADPKSVVLQVKDTGIGISSEHTGRVFERFYRVDKSRSRLSGGTGLGLSIVKHIVEAHGGEVSLESVLNRGTTVRATIPTGASGPE